MEGRREGKNEQRKERTKEGTKEGRNKERKECAFPLIPISRIMTMSLFELEIAQNLS